MASARRASNRPVCLCTRAADRLIHMTASTKAGSGRSPEIGKFSAARSVWIPYNASEGTAFSPNGSRSMRVLLTGLTFIGFAQPSGHNDRLFQIDRRYGHVRQGQGGQG